MASRIEFVNYIVDQLSILGDVSYRPMMGEYLIYVKGKYVVGICDDKMYLKPTKKVEALLKEIVMEPMYDGAKPSFLINDVDDREYLIEIVRVTYEELPIPKKKKS